MTLEHTSSKSLEYIYNNSQQYIVWLKIIDFYFMPKIIMILRSCSMKIFSRFLTVNISKLNYWLVISIAKNFIWTTLKMIFSIFGFFCILRFQIYKYCPIITNHTSMEIWFIQLCDFEILMLRLVLWSRSWLFGHESDWSSSPVLNDTCAQWRGIFSVNNHVLFCLSNGFRKLLWYYYGNCVSVKKLESLSLHGF